MEEKTIKYNELKDKFIESNNLLKQKNIEINKLQIMLNKEITVQQQIMGTLQCLGELMACLNDPEMVQKDIDLIQKI
jgi:hypothetical protein